MADVKISGLPVSTTPLTGTEVLPIVQSSTTKKVAVSDLTAGRTVDALALNATTVDTTNLEVTNLKAKDGTAAGSIADITGIVTIGSSVLTTTDINGGTIDGTTVGATTASTGRFSNLTNTGLTSGRVTYATTAGLLTDSANLTFNGTTLTAAALTSTGVATFSAGTVSAPAIIPTGDTNTGIFFPAADSIAFVEGGVQAATIDSDSNFLVGATANAGVGVTLRPASTVIQNNNAEADGFTFSAFRRSTVTVGSITQSGTTGVLYNLTSDYRLKENQQPLTGSGAFIDALKPKTWDWTTDGSKGVGFIAHEIQEVSPSSVSGKKDAVDEEGKPVYQGMQPSSAEMIANIVAELQSLRQRVAQLEG